MKIKICGIKYFSNLVEIQTIHPDYLGFIFYDKSKRYMQEKLSAADLALVPSSIKKVGVFVNESIDNIINIVQKYQLDAIQLHGDETAKKIKKIKKKLVELDKSSAIEIIKAFGVDEDFNFKQLNDYKQCCNYFLFDTKTANYGGSGRKFNWEILNQYDNELPLFLSGGIGVEDLQSILKLNWVNIHAVDLNSQLEIEAGMKDTEKVKRAVEIVRVNNQIGI